MIRGNLIGSKNYPTINKAHGVWSLQEQFLATKAAIWPQGFQVNATNLVLYVNAALPSSYSGTGTQWTDLSGNNNHGTLIGSPTYSAAGKAFTFNGSSQYVNFTVTKTASCTFSCWAKTTAALTQPMLFIAGADGSGPDLFFYSGVIAWNTWDGATASFGSIPATANNGGWHLYTVVNDSAANNAKLYYDGSLLGTTTYKSATASTILRVGGVTGGYLWDGQIGFFTVNNTALTAADITANYNTQKTVFS